MLDAKNFYSVPNWLDVEGGLPVIVSGRKPACWHCGEIGHLSAVCSGKKAPKKPDQNPGTLPPVVTNTEKEAPVVSPTSAGKKIPTLPSSSTVSSEESGAEWLTVGKGGRKIQPADPHSRKSSQVGTNSSPTSKSQSYAQLMKSPSTKYPPKTPPKQPTPPKVRSFSLGREKFEQLLEFKKQLDQQRKSTPQPGPSRSTPSSPKQPRTIRPPITPLPKSMPPPTMTSLKPQPKKGPPSPLPLDAPPTRPSPPPAAATISSTVSSPSTTPKKRQRSSSIDSSGDKVPKHKKKEKKEKPRPHTGLNICRVDGEVLDRLHKVQPQLLKDLRVLHNFKEVSGQNLEDPQNFPNVWVTSVIRKGWESE